VATNEVESVAADVSRRIARLSPLGPPPYGGGYGEVSSVAADVSPQIARLSPLNPPPDGGGYQ